MSIKEAFYGKNSVMGIHTWEADILSHEGVGVSKRYKGKA